jgi:NAD(P)H-hydrate epimerase
MREDKASAAGVYVHALAGERWQERTGSDRGLLAGEIAEMVPELVAELMRMAHAR